MFIFILALHIFGKPGNSACLLLIGNCGLPVLVLKAYTFKDKEIV